MRPNPPVNPDARTNAVLCEPLASARRLLAR
jgi:hypothetical protein